MLCAEHDSLMSSLAPIPLSNLDQAPTRVGYAAAALLVPDQYLRMLETGHFRHDWNGEVCFDQQSFGLLEANVADLGSWGASQLSLKPLLQEPARYALGSKHIRYVDRSMSVILDNGRLSRTGGCCCAVWSPCQPRGRRSCSKKPHGST